MSEHPNIKQEPAYQRADLVPKGITGAAARHALGALVQALSSTGHEELTPRGFRHILHTVAIDKGVDPSALEATVAVALAGLQPCLDLGVAASVLGRDRVVGRLRRAIEELSVVARR